MNRFQYFMVHVTAGIWSLLKCWNTLKCRGSHLDICCTSICARWFCAFYLGKSPSNHHWGEYVWNFFPSILSLSKFITHFCDPRFIFNHMFAQCFSGNLSFYQSKAMKENPVSGFMLEASWANWNHFFYTLQWTKMQRWFMTNLAKQIMIKFTDVFSLFLRPPKRRCGFTISIYWGSS